MGEESEITGQWQVLVAASTGRCNTSVESLCRCFKPQGFAWPFVELTRHFVQMSLRVYRHVGAFGEVLSEQAIRASFFVMES